jgi:Ni/Fe-hydrogenase subunit HybB-like protein
MPLVIIDGITNGLSSSVYSKELEKNYTFMPLVITDEITNGLSLSIFKRVEKIHSNTSDHYIKNHRLIEN